MGRGVYTEGDQMSNLISFQLSKQTRKVRSLKKTVKLGLQIPCMFLFKSLSTDHPYLNLVNIYWRLILYYALESWGTGMDTILRLFQRRDDFDVGAVCIQDNTLVRPQAQRKQGHPVIQGRPCLHMRHRGSQRSSRRLPGSPHPSCCHCFIYIVLFLKP